MRRLSIFLCILCLLCVKIYSQQSAHYLIPQRIFVGDPATLVVPLSSSTTTNITITTDLPTHESIDFHKISLQSDRLSIDFTAFATGEFEFPIIEIAGHYFPNLKVTVSSIIDKSSPIVLSAPASSLSMPGTSLMLYGTMALIVFTLLASIWFFTKGKKIIAVWKEKWKRWRLFTNMRQTERRLNKLTLKGADKKIILNNLSDEFRNFLSILFNQNCRAMTAREFTESNSVQLQDNSINITEYFTLCDNYRFSGTEATKDNILQLLKTLREFIDKIEQRDAA